MHRLLRARLLVPVGVAAGVAAAGLLAFAPAAQAGTSPSGSSSSSASSLHASTASASVAPAASGSSGSASEKAAGINPVTLPSSYIAPGEALFAANCASCHGTDASGTSRAPNLQGLGAGTIDFWVSTGRMPLADPTEQAVRKPPRFDTLQTLEIAAYVQSLTPGLGVPIYHVNLSQADLAQGQSLFTLNCAACHTITGAGDALADGAFAPSLHVATPTQIIEAIRTGPGNMPHFSAGNITNAQARDIVAYVHEVIQHPTNRGGFGLGGNGPVAEGFVALLIGVGGLLLVAFWIGERA
jgi:ubiquinol-cytochrome c reductase cytochrome c subunit